jgi:hypothetical protein
VRVEDETLAKAMGLLRPDKNLLPERKLLAGRLLDKNFNQVKELCQSYLSDKTLYFCMTTDGWSNVCYDAPVVEHIGELIAD